ncbi:PREDICTED: actin-related protein 6-like [Priapulus caudatus]|uniref:Actin-related protein 6-like n=1 Tax=Priapulus caudatus TaxID=37621 RepID=A0ABM1E3C9_PRICU|nr:PREDICTED: actin-related protein 6-like [Priapulus caudatus]
MAAVILDNGAYTAKVGFSTDNESRVVANYKAKAKNERKRAFIASQLDDCKDYSGLYYLLPFQKGFLVNWDVEREVWDFIFGKDLLNVSFKDTGMVITEPYFNFGSIQETMNEIFFEEYNFKSLLRTNAGTLSAFKNRQEDLKRLCCLVVDSGYSFTHVAPYCGGKKIVKAVYRIEVGGKMLTNHLKEMISYRQLHVMDETYVMNQVKEDVCYASLELYKDMEIARKKGKANTNMRDYVLPDYAHIKRGYTKPADDESKMEGHEQILRMNNERFTIPEILFHPSDIGIHQMGIPELIVQSIQQCPEEMQPHLYMNIVLTGGNMLFPGIQERVYKEVRALAPDYYKVNVHCPENAITYAWTGGKALVGEQNTFKKMSVTREQYEEHGQNICIETFDV